jgi:hypothetical protein
VGVFRYEDDLLKHFVRTTGWLPRCERRLKIVRSKARRPSESRRLRYFTFCAINAIDVLMLDVAKVIRQSNSNEFDTVVFFDRDELDVLETQKRIRGAHGYPGEFVDIVLHPDPDEAAVRDGLEVLSPPQDQPDRADVRQLQRRLAVRREFIREFPFDIVNLDLEGYFFRRNDPFPGKMIASLRKLLDWQKIPIDRESAHPEGLDGFSLMFTTKIGPPDLTEDYLDMLQNAIQENLERDDDLVDILTRRAGTADVAELRGRNFEVFFKVALPKLIMALLMEEDWCIDIETGISMYEIERRSREGQAYRMLHVVLDIVRQEPPRHRRAPGAGPVQYAVDGYSETARIVFGREETRVTTDMINERALRESLENIYARCRKYYPEVEMNTGELGNAPPGEEEQEGEEG